MYRGIDVCDGILTPITAHSLISGYFSDKDLTYPGSSDAITGGGKRWKKSPRFFCFSSVSGGNQLS